jgi:AcrR family transcriptional regulator
VPDCVCDATGGGAPEATGRPRRPAADVPGAGVSAVAHELRPGRERMLSVARRLFCSQGYDRTPLRAISDALGVTKAAVYYHFKAKDDILGILVTPVLDRIDALVDSAGGSPRLEGDDRGRFLQGYVDLLRADGDITALLFADPAVVDHPLGRRFATQRQRIHTLLGAGMDLPACIRASVALRTLELALIEFGDAEPAQVSATALSIALTVLDAGGS